MTTIDQNSKDNTSDNTLLAQYVSCFEHWDDLQGIGISKRLQVAVDDRGWQTWRPTQMTTDTSALEALYRVLPAHFPPLYEHLILSYRWATVDLDNYSLLGNEPAHDLAPLLHAIRQDQFLSTTLLSNGFLQFGQAGGGNYDPVCFDLNKPTKTGDYSIVQLDHESILCYGRIGKVTQLAPDFRTLVIRTISKAG